MKNSVKISLLIFSLLLAWNVFSSEGAIMQTLQLPNSGTISYPLSIDVDFSKVTGSNNLSLGVQVGYEWYYLSKYPELQSKFAECKFGMVRFFVYNVQPCTRWDEATRSGTYNWTKFDTLMQTIHSADVENIMITIAHNNDDPEGLPPGMERTYNNSGFPDPISFAIYSRDIALHIKNSGWSVKYWEPHNEPGFKDNASARVFVELFNDASDAILQVFPDALFGVDASNRKTFLDNFARVARNVGFLSFHKYVSSGTLVNNTQAYASDDQVLTRASLFGSNDYYTPQEMRDAWFRITGTELPVIISETNLASWWMNGTDPRQQDLIGAVWYSEQLRASILADIRYSVYFTFASDGAWTKPNLAGGYGFGMVNATPPHAEWYPFFANYLFSNYLQPGSTIFDSSSSNTTAVSVLAWSQNGNDYVLLIGKVKGAETSVRVNFKRNFANMTILEINQNGLQSIQQNFADPSNFLEQGYFVKMIVLS